MDPTRLLPLVLLFLSFAACPGTDPDDPTPTDNDTSADDDSMVGDDDSAPDDDSSGDDDSVGDDDTVGDDDSGDDDTTPLDPPVDVPAPGLFHLHRWNATADLPAGAYLSGVFSSSASAAPLHDPAGYLAWAGLPTGAPEPSGRWRLPLGLGWEDGAPLATDWDFVGDNFWRAAPQITIGPSAVAPRQDGFFLSHGVWWYGAPLAPSAILGPATLDWSMGAGGSFSAATLPGAVRCPAAVEGPDLLEDLIHPWTEDLPITWVPASPATDPILLVIQRPGGTVRVLQTDDDGAEILPATEIGTLPGALRLSVIRVAESTVALSEGDVVVRCDQITRATLDLELAAFSPASGQVGTEVVLDAARLVGTWDPAVWFDFGPGTTVTATTVDASNPAIAHLTLSLGPGATWGAHDVVVHDGSTTFTVADGFSVSLPDLGYIEGGEDCSNLGPDLATGHYRGSLEWNGDDISLPSDPVLSCTGWASQGADQVFQLDMDAGEVIDVSFLKDGGNASVYLLEACGNVAACVAGSDLSADSAVLERFVLAVPHGGWFYLVLDDREPDTGGQWDLWIQRQGP